MVETKAVNFRETRPLFFVCGLLAALAAGCATKTLQPDKPDLVLVIPGIGGDGGVYGGVVQALRDGGSNDCLAVSDWGSSYPLFFISISSGAWHESAEKKLAAKLVEWRAAHPQSRLALIAHSAGAGVALGALARLPAGMQVGPVILLAPALGQRFDLAPALRHATAIHVFFSGDDFFWQGIGPIVFGNYDGVHANGAGRRGFALTGLTAAEKSKVVQHPFQKQWRALGNDGGHFDWLARPFVEAVIEPIVDGPAEATISARKGQ